MILKMIFFWVMQQQAGADLLRILRAELEEQQARAGSGSASSTSSQPDGAQAPAPNAAHTAIASVLREYMSVRWFQDLDRENAEVCKRMRMDMFAILLMVPLDQPRTAFTSQIFLCLRNMWDNNLRSDEFDGTFVDSISSIVSAYLDGESSAHPKRDDKKLGGALQILRYLTKKFRFTYDLCEDSCASFS